MFKRPDEIWWFWFKLLLPCGFRYFLIFSILFLVHLFQIYLQVWKHVLPDIKLVSSIQEMYNSYYICGHKDLRFPFGNGEDLHVDISSWHFLAITQQRKECKGKKSQKGYGKHFVSQNEAKIYKSKRYELTAHCKPHCKPTEAIKSTTLMWVTAPKEREPVRALHHNYLQTVPKNTEGILKIWEAD